MKPSQKDPSVTVLPESACIPLNDCTIATLTVSVARNLTSASPFQPDQTHRFPRVV